MLNYFFDLSTLRNSIKIYWSISWRATIYGITIAIILFNLYPFLINVLMNSDHLNSFRELFFNLSPFSGQEELIKHPSFIGILYGNSWAFIFNYSLYFFGFKRILTLNLYPELLKRIRPFHDYNKIFLGPLLIDSFMDLNFLNVNTKRMDLTITFFVIINGIYYFLLLRNFKKLMQQS